MLWGGTFIFIIIVINNADIAVRCIPRYFCSTKSSKRPSTALINHTINQNSIQLSAQTPSKLSVSLIIKFRRGLSLFARGWAPAWHCHFRHWGKAVSALSSCSSVPQRCRKQRDGDGWLLVTTFLIIFLFLFFPHCFFTSSCLKLFLSICIISTFPFAPLFSSHSFPLPHHLPSTSPSLSCSFPLLPLPIPPPHAPPPHQSKEIVTQRKNKNWTCANAMGQEATYGTSKSQSHEGC